MAAHSSIPPWRIPWTEEPSRQQSIVSQRVRHDWSDWTHTHTTQWKRQALPYFFFSEEERLLWEDNWGDLNPMTLSSILISRGRSTAFDAIDYSLSETFSPFGFEKILSSRFSSFLTSHSVSYARSFISPALQCWRVPGFRPQTSTLSTLTPMGIYLISSFSIISVHQRLIHLFLQSEPLRGPQTYISNWCFNISIKMSNHRFKLIMSKYNSLSSVC